MLYNRIYIQNNSSYINIGIKEKGGLNMLTIKNIFFILLAGFFFFSFLYEAHAATCDEIVGVWKWDNGDTTSFNSDGSIKSEYANGKAGSWECINASTGLVKTTWNADAFNNTDKYNIFSTLSTVVLSEDGKNLKVGVNSNSYEIKSAEKKFGVVYAKEQKNKNTDDVSISVDNLNDPKEIISDKVCQGENCNSTYPDKIKFGDNRDFNYENSSSQDKPSHWFLQLIHIVKTTPSLLINSIYNKDIKGILISLFVMGLFIFIIGTLYNLYRQ